MVTVGIDEVGRGCWAGPLVAGAVLLDPLQSIAGLQDSKVLTKAKRELLASEIHHKALAVGLGWVWPQVIDERGLTYAVTQAMHDAFAAIQSPYERIIVDGHINYLADIAGSEAIIKADASHACVSAASIVAKVARDNWMAKEAHRLFPNYGFDRHVGYGTAAHRAALQTFGVCKIHRTSYKPIKAIMSTVI